MLKLVNDYDDKEFEPCPQGSFTGRCRTVMDLGMQTTNFGTKRQVYIQFELEKQRDDGQPWCIGGTFTFSIHPKAKLTGLLAGWRGKAFEKGEQFDLSTILGRYCTVLVVHEFGVPDTAGKVKTYAKIAGLTHTKNTFDPVLELLCNDSYLDAPEWLQTKVEIGMKALKDQEQDLANQATSDKQTGTSTADLDDEVPF